MDGEVHNNNNNNKRLVKERKKIKSCLKLKSFFFLIKEKKIVDIYAIK